MIEGVFAIIVRGNLMEDKALAGGFFLRILTLCRYCDETKERGYFSVIDIIVALTQPKGLSESAEIFME
jgi:hypothetical protein